MTDNTPLVRDCYLTIKKTTYSNVIDTQRIQRVLLSGGSG